MYEDWPRRVFVHGEQEKKRKRKIVLRIFIQNYLRGERGDYLKIARCAKTDLVIVNILIIFSLPLQIAKIFRVSSNKSLKIRYAVAK